MTKTLAFIIGLIVGVLLYMGIEWYAYQKINTPPPYQVHDVYYDTIPYYQMVPKDSLVIRYVTKTLPVSENVKDSIRLACGDSVSIDLPITQKEYRDSTYVAWVSGYEPALDSLHIFQKTYTTTIYQPEYIKTKPKRWGLGLQVGAGVTPDKITPYIGIGVSYNIFTW